MSIFIAIPRARFELVVGIAYGDSMEQARSELLALAEADERVRADPAPLAFVASLGDSSVGIGLRVWCNTGDYLALSWALTELAKARFDEVGLSIPFPQRDVNLAGSQGAVRLESPASQAAPPSPA